MADVLLIVALRQFWSREVFFGTLALPKNRGHMLTTKIGSNLNRPVWPVYPGGLTCLDVCRRSGMTNRSDRSRRSPSTIRVLNRFRSVNRISCGVSLPHPINIKGHGRLKGQPNRIYQKHIFYLFTFTLLFQPRHDFLLSSPWHLRTP